MDRSDIESMIIFEDEEILAINKPPGFLSIPDGYNSSLPNLKKDLDNIRDKVWTVHRLDKETSGVIVFAKTAATHCFLNDQFASHETKKVYHAIIHGHLESEIIINKPLLVNGDRRHRTVVNYSTGKNAVTEVKLLRHLKSFSLVEVRPKSGYTHQIRAHLLSSGFPILGDSLYSQDNLPENAPISRTALHAFSLSIVHPTSKETLTLIATYPQDFSKTLDCLTG